MVEVDGSVTLLHAELRSFFVFLFFFSQNSLSGKPEHSLEKFQFTDLPNSVPVLSKVKY